MNTSRLHFIDAKGQNATELITPFLTNFHAVRSDLRHAFVTFFFSDERFPRNGVSVHLLCQSHYHRLFLRNESSVGCVEWIYE
ncbi:hypothetical protein ACTXT7_011588 [Hymenolepis weldensis]